MSNFDTAYKRLNPEQKKAVDTLYGPVSVIAGPGTGKTQLLTLRIANILKKTDASPYNILALTFTEAGVVAMRDRLRSFIGPDAYKVNIATFHGFCNTLITENPEIFQFARKLQMLEDLDKNKLVGNIYLKGKWTHLYNRFDPEMYLGATIHLVSTMKREGISPENLRERIKQAIEELPNDEELYYKRDSKFGKKGDKKPQYFKTEQSLLKQLEFCDVYEKYEEELKENGWYDYDDMIFMVVSKMREDKNFLAELQEQFQFLLVDEYQDTNGLQNTIVTKLLEGLDQPNILVVGDDEQSIYRFQGAVMENVLSFHKDYEKFDITTVVLTQNYRSTQTILDSSREVIRHNTQTLENELSLEKTLTSNTSEKKKIETYFPEDSSVEVHFVVEEIRKMITGGVSPSEIAVIYRKNSNPLELIEAFRRADIPFRKQKGENLLHHPEAQKLLKTLSVIENISDNELLWDVLLLDFWQLDIHHLLEIQNATKGPSGGSKRIKFWEAFLDSDDMATKIVVGKLVGFHKDAANKTLTEFFESFLESSGYREFILEQDDSLERLNILGSFFDEVKKFAGAHPDAGITDFVSYMQDLDKYGLAPMTQPLKTHTDAVRLMTAHGSKGLEYENVILYQATTKNWENSRPPVALKLSVDLFHDHALLSSQDQKDLRLEEDRRLFYVAMTRAKSRLIITATKSEIEKSDPSQFVYEIPDDFVQDRSTETFEPREVLTLSTAPVQAFDWTEATKTELARRANEYVLSVTALNTWLRSPAEFLAKYLVRRPQGKMVAASFGTVVHGVLAYISNYYQKADQMPSEKSWQEVMDEYLDKEILTKNEKERLREQAVSLMQAYIQAPDSPITLPAKNEQRFGRKSVVVEGMPITGAIDKVEILDSTTVQVVDYKTGKSAKPKEVMDDYERQLYFYKLLWDGSGQDKVLERGILDFVEDLNGEKIRRKEFVFEPEKIRLLTAQVKRFRESLEQLDFPDEPFEIS